MNLDGFYKEIENVVVYPGSLDELNDEQMRNSARQFRLFSQNEARRFIEGILIPSPGEIDEGFAVVRSLIEDPSDDELIKKVELGLREAMDLQYSNQQIQDLDIRLRAYRMHADGIIRMQYIGSSELVSLNPKVKLSPMKFFMGKPVKYF